MDSRGGRQVFYVVTGAPRGSAPSGYEGRCLFHLRVRNTNSVYNHLDVTTKTRVLDLEGGGRSRVVKAWASSRGRELEDESSRVITYHLEPRTLADAYNSDSPLTRLEVEYHWRELGESRQRHFNRTGLTFPLVAPIEFLLSQQRRLHTSDIELKDARYKNDYWIPVTRVNFTRDIRTPFTVQLDVSSTVSQEFRVDRRDTATASRSTTRTRTASDTFSFQISGEGSQGGSVSASIEVLEAGLSNMFKLGASMGYSRTRTDTSSTTVAREFSQSLGMSRGYSASGTTTTRTTITVQPPGSDATSGPQGTGHSSRRTSGGAHSVGVYLYPLIAFFEVPYVRFSGVNSLGQATSRTAGTVALPKIISWGLTSVRN